MPNTTFNVLISTPSKKLKDVLNVLPSNRFNVCACPTIDIRAVEKDKSLEHLFSQILMFDYLVFTSQYAVIETFDYLNQIGIKPKQLNSLRIYALGPVVSQQLNRFGLVAHMMPHKYSWQSLADLFPSVRARSLKILYPTGDRSTRNLEGALTKKGYEIVSPIIYSAELRETLEDQAQELIDSNDVDCMAFTSPSSVVAFVSILNKTSAANLLNNMVISAIGPSTDKACKEAGLTVDILPNEYTIQGMARAIANYYSKKSKQAQ